MSDPKQAIYSQRWREKNPWRYKYNQAVGNARIRSIPFLMSFDEWCALWIESGKWEQRGWHKGQYVMARYGDKGAYEISNVKICLAEENRAERNQNYPMKGERNPAHGKNYWEGISAEEDARRREVTRRTFKGKLWGEAQRLKMATTVTGRKIVLRDNHRRWSHPGDADYPEAVHA
jgi:hypothetical protein